MRTVKRCLPILFIFSALLFQAGCDTIDCTLYNTVICKASFYGDGKAVAITDVLTVTTCGVDSVLINQKREAQTLELPLSYWQDTDTLVFSVMGEEYALMDTLWIDKENSPHFESPDCPCTMFHRICAVRTTHTFIDSVTIVQPLVNYEETEHLQIHVHTGN
jgi:hypothetical protein